jgi:hypothetical protein
MAALADLVRELKALRKGRGLYAGRFEERVGPTLRAACEVTDGDGMMVVRQKVANRLTELADQLPDDLRVATLAAFALNAEARLPLYQDRVHWAAIQVDRDPRTVRRRVDEAIDQLAELAVSSLRLRGGAQEPSWRFAMTRVILVLDAPIPEALELHRIVAEQDNLAEIDLPSVFGQPAVFYGGTLRGTTLNLPHPLTAGETHEFAFRSTNPAHLSQFLYTPRRRSELVEIRVRFNHDHLPCAGEIRLTFRDVPRGVPCGARWDHTEG